MVDAQVSKDEKEIISLVAALIDESGSMEDVHVETIRGYNIFVSDIQKEQEGKEAYVSTFLFDYHTSETPIVRTLQSGKKLSEAIELSETNYRPRGGTPLYDAIAYSIAEIDKIVNEKKIDKVTFIIQTDGVENRSQEIRDPTKIKEMIEKRIASGWQVVFLGADVRNATTMGTNLGVSSSNSRFYSKAATIDTFRTASASTQSYRSGGSSDMNLSDEDLKKMQNKK